MDNDSTFIRDIWYYALESKYLKPGQMLSKILLNEPILFGRDRTGKAFALRDICPHRAVPLSEGRFDGKSVECAYHGWQFNTDGQCTAIPSLLEEHSLDLSRCRVMSYPVHESQGNIWIFMPSAETKQTVNPPIAAPAVAGFDAAKTYQMAVKTTFPCHIDHAVIGLMDPAHVPFVHRSWWWYTRPELSEEVKTFDPSPYGFTMRRHKLENMTLLYRLIGKAPEVEISFRLPGVRVETVSAEQNLLANLTAITPISDHETEVTTMFYSTISWIPLLKPVFIPLINTFLNQDKGMVEKQQIGLQYDPRLMLIPDADMQARWYYQVKKEFIKSTEEKREFVHPLKEQRLSWRS